MFNSCLVSTKWSYNDKMLGVDFIVPSLYVGDIEKIRIKSKNNDTEKEITITPGSLLVQRETVVNNWVITRKTTHIENSDYIL